MDDSFKVEACQLNSKIPKELRSYLYKKFAEFKLREEKFAEIVGHINNLTNVHLESAEHSIRVASLCEKIALELGIDPKALFYSGLIHDLGKALIPISTLGKTHDFSEKDMEIMKEHPKYTLRLVGDSFAFSAQVGARHHRHKVNPYPEHIPESSIPFSDKTKEIIEYYSQFIAIADVFDAKVTRYNEKNKDNKPVSLENAISEIIGEMPEKKEVINRLNSKGIFKEHIKLVNQVNQLDSKMVR